MNTIHIEVDTTHGTTKDVTLACGDQVISVDIPDSVFYGIDGRTPDPKYVLRDICEYLRPALAMLQVTSTYEAPAVPEPPVEQLPPPGAKGASGEFHIDVGGFAGDDK